MREPITKQIADDDGTLHEYTFVPTPGRRALRLANKLQNILLAPVLSALGGLRKGKAGGDFLDREIDAAAMGAVSSVLMNALVAAGEDKLLVEILQDATTRRADGKTYKCGDAFDLLYTDNLGEMALAVGEALRVTYGRSAKRLFSGLPLFQEGLSAILSQLGIALPEQP